MKILNISDTLPGDIILSSSKTLSSVAIRAVTGSLKASHALIVINPVIWFEAVNPNIRYKIVDPVMVRNRDEVFIGTYPDRGEKYYVYRSKSIIDTSGFIKFDEIALNLLNTSSLFCLLNFAEPEHFLPILKWKIGNIDLIRSLAEAARQSKTTEFDGVFCSWLVALCYKNLGLDFFQGAPQTISPATIARSDKFECIGECQNNATVINKNLDLDRLLHITSNARAMLNNIDKHTNSVKDTISSLHNVLSHSSDQALKYDSNNTYDFSQHELSYLNLMTKHFNNIRKCTTEMIEYIYPESYKCIYGALGYAPNNYKLDITKWCRD